jgi:cell division septation protein DedD
MTAHASYTEDTVTSPRPDHPQGDDDNRLPVGQFATATVAVIAIAAIIAGIVLVLSGGDGGGDQTQAPPAGTPDQQPTEQPTVAPPPSDDDAAAIQALARNSIEVLPAGQWPSLYNSFTDAFHQRCPEAEFDQQGDQAAQDLGQDILLLSFSRLDDLDVDGDTAEATIVGQLEGQGEYRIQATFRREDGAWKIAPAPDTEGCQAFGRLD